MARTPAPTTVGLPSADTPVKAPLRVWIAGAVAAFALGGAWFALQLHARDDVRHLDAHAVAERGGPVYRTDLRDVRDELRQAIRDEGETTRKAFAAAPKPGRLRCRVPPGSREWVCESE